MKRLWQFVRELRRRQVFRVAAIYLVGVWVVLQVADLAFESFELPEQALRYIWIGAFIGFPLALILGWKYDITANGIVRTPVVDSELPSDLSLKRVDYIILAGLSIVVGIITFGLAQEIVGTRDTTPTTIQATNVPENSIAVFPFENLSADSDNEYFSKGMTAELISRLSRIQNLQVVSYFQTKEDINEIGQELKVRYLLEGTVRRSGSRVRISALLIDSSTGFNIWSENFDGELQDVFDLQEQTALKIADALDIHLSPEEAEAIARHDTENLEAYDAFLRGWTIIESFHYRSDNFESRLNAARNHFQQALEFDPNYSLAVAGLSMVESNYVLFGSKSAPEQLLLAHAFATEALALDTSLPEPHLALGLAHGAGGDYVRAVDEFREAVSLDPQNGYTWCDLAWAYNRLQPPSATEAEKASREAIRLTPAYFWAYVILGDALRFQEHSADAISAYEYALILNPDHNSAHVKIGRIFFKQGNYHQALTAFNKAEQTPAVLVRISRTHLALGDIQKGLERLEEALADGYSDFITIETSPEFASLADDTRFQQLLDQYRK
ncbi:MAG: tetratricopeptide repeat protein [Proteobacteria bacterium]|nr:tetratricopeptide repeat protein [Pseudomonadota bacterium]